MAQSTPIRRLVRAALLERERLLKALTRDSRDAEFQGRLHSFLFGLGEDLDSLPDFVEWAVEQEQAARERGEGFDNPLDSVADAALTPLDPGEVCPAGATAAAVVELHAPDRSRLFEHWRRAAIARALEAPARDTLLLRIDAAAEAHRNFCEAVLELSLSPGGGTRFTCLGDALEKHSSAWQRLIDILPAEVAAPPSVRAAEPAKPEKAKAGKPPGLTAEELALRQTLRDAWLQFRDSDYRAEPKPLFYVRAGSHEHFAWLYSQRPNASPQDPEEIVRLLVAHKKYLSRRDAAASAKPKRRGKGQR